MSYPPRCCHGVILCDACAKTVVGDNHREKVVELLREKSILADRLRTFERQLADMGEENYDLKQRIRQLEAVNSELQELGGNRRTRRESL